MATGISFSTKKEADEYRAKLLREGKSSKLSIEPNGIYRVVVTGEVIPSTEDEPLMTAISEEEPTERFVCHGASAGDETTCLALGGKWVTESVDLRLNIQERKKETGRVVKGTTKTTGEMIGRDIAGSFKRQKGTLGGVKAGMIRAIPARPYTSGAIPRIGTEGAVGVGNGKTPRITQTYTPPTQAKIHPPKGFYYLKSSPGKEREEK